MNYLKIASVILTVSFASSTTAQTYKFVALDNSMETKFCVNAGNNDLKALKMSLHSLGSHTDRRFNINSISCNDISAAKFAFKYNAGDTMKYLNKYSYRKNRAQTSVTITDVAKANIDDNSTPIIVYVSTPK